MIRCPRQVALVRCTGGCVSRATDISGHSVHLTAQATRRLLATRSAVLGATGGAVAARGGGVQRTHTLGQLRARRELGVLGIGQCARGQVPRDRVMRVELRHTPEIAPGTQPGARLRTSRKALAALPYSYCSMKPAPWK